MTRRNASSVDTPCPRMPGQHWHGCKAGLVMQDGKAVCRDCRQPSAIKPDHATTGCFFREAARGEIAPSALAHLMAGGRFVGLDYGDENVRRALREIKAAAVYADQREATNNA